MAKSPKGKTKKVSKALEPASGFEQEKEESIDLKAIVRDERTWKIVGVMMVFFSLFLLVSFSSYLFNWQNDASVVSSGSSALFSEQQVQNAAGVLGALTAAFFFEQCFGFASFLVCTFFFVVGVNLLFRRRVFSIWRNVKYVTIGMLVASVTLSFLFPESKPFGGGAVGLMINQSLNQALGKIGTGALLFVSLIAYLIWQFNPQLKWPVKEEKETADELTETDDLLPDSEETEKEESAVVAPLTTAGMTVNEMYQQQEGPVVVQFPVEEEPVMNMTLIEKEDDEEVPEAAVEISEEPKPIELNPHVSVTLPAGMSSGMQDVLTTGQGIEEDMDPIDNNENELALEIKTVPDPVEEEIIEVAKEELKPYEPTLDLRDYKYPSLDLLEQHGSEKIIQDNNELENNKNQIIATLRNYSIEIQKISATVGPTVTLYEIVPAAGVRISKIKNLEDDIALSLAALGIRIILADRDR